MEIKVKNVDFSRELALLEKVVGQKPTISVLANVLIQAHGGGLLLSATDLEIGLVGACAADVIVPGAVTLPVKKLMEIVRAQSDNTLSLKADTRGAVSFSSGGFRSRLQSLPASDFPGIPSMDGHETASLPREGLKEAIAQVRYATSEKDKRFFLNGVQMKLTDADLVLSATDGARVSITKLAYVGEPWPPVLIPVKCLDELSALLTEKGAGDITFAESERHLFFDFDGRLLISRKVDGTFPDVTKIVPKLNEHEATVHRLDLVAALKRTVLIHDIVETSFSASGLRLSAASADVGEGYEDLPITYTGPTVTIRFKGEYLLDFLTAASGETIKICLRDAAAPALCTDGEYLNVVLGMRV